MNLRITGRHLTVTPALRRDLEDRAQRLDRYGVRLDGGQFVLGVEKHRHAAEGTVAVNGRIIQVYISRVATLPSNDRLLEKLERQLLKGKEKLVERKVRKRAARGAREAVVVPSADGRSTVTRVAAPVLSLEEALDRLRTQRSPVVVFQNVVTCRLQAVQRADDGHVEFIDTASSTLEE